MRILAVTSLFPSPWQPRRAPFNRQQFRALAAEHELRVIAPVAWTDEWRVANRGSPQWPDTRLRSRIQDGFIVHHPRYLFPPKLLRASYGRCFQRSIGAAFHEAVREFRPDVVLTCWAYPDGWATVRLARQAGLPVVLKVHGSDLLTAGRSTARRSATSEALAEADAVVAVSRHLGTSATEMGAHPSRLHVVYNGVERRLFRPLVRGECRERLGLTDTRPLLLFVGNLVPVKGPDLLLEALALLSRRAPEFQCVYVGEGGLRRALRAQVDALALSGRIRFVGARPLEELPLWYSAADLLVVPSRSEGIPNVLLEAAACGTPFVTSRVGGIPEFAADEALVPAGDPAALAGRIEEALARPRHPVAGLTSPVSWADSARALAAVLERVTTEHHARLSRTA
jgi:glycosyltransferase involved in cell wall biosynthesis